MHFSPLPDMKGHPSHSRLILRLITLYLYENDHSCTLSWLRVWESNVIDNGNVCTYMLRCVATKTHTRIPFCEVVLLTKR